jgi:outer membrane receptor protein involved in Fe transport
VTITPIPAAVGAEAEGTDTSYRLSASYRVTPRITTYATYATGYRPPIVNARAGAVSLVNPADIIIPQGAESDQLRNYEVGVKGTWFDGRLAANLSAYHIDWSDIQVQANRVSDSVQFATNIGAAISQGLEFEVSVLPIDNLQILLSGAFNDSRISDLSATEAAISGAIEGVQLASPHFQGSATIRYNFDVGPNADGWVAANIMHVGQFPGLFPNNPGQPGIHNPNFARTEDYDVINMFAGLIIGNTNVTAYIENVTDDDSITYVHPEAFIASKFGVLRPRTVGVRVGFSM